jgi:hypothetical protein
MASRSSIGKRIAVALLTAGFFFSLGVPALTVLGAR